MTSPTGRLPGWTLWAGALSVVLLAFVGTGVGVTKLLADESAQARAFVVEGEHDLARGDRATAVLAFERARWLAPRAAVVRSALDAAAVKDDASPLRRALCWVTAREWSALGTGCGWLSGLAIVWVLASPGSRGARRLALAAGGVFMLGMTGIMEANASSSAVVMGTDARLLVAPYAAAAAEKPLDAGTIVTVGSAHDDFVRVEDADGTRGWLRRSDIECIARSDG